MNLFGRKRNDDAAGEWLAALGEPAAICAADARVLACNSSWRATVGPGPRDLPAREALYPAFRAARAGGRGEGRASLGGGDFLVHVAPVDEGRLLVRLTPAPPAVTPAPAAVAETAGAGRLAATAPFGAALIEGDDPFEGAILETNPALWAIAGREPEGVRRLADLFTPASVADVAAQRREGASGPFEVALAAAPTRSAQLAFVPSEGGVAAYVLDVTAQRDLQLQLAQRHKMEAIGQLAGGVAHDFNNLLSAIGMRVDDLLQRHPLGDPAYESLSEVREGVNKAAALVLQLLTFSRKATVRREVVDLGEALIDFEILLRRLLRENMRLDTDYAPATPKVRIDRSQLEMAVMNLVVNARDAMRGGGGETRGGVIRLRTARVEPAEADALGYPGPASGELVLIEVSDDGPGIPPEVIGSIFEPFFTTKAVGEGTGLGLATVYGIVKQADGAIVAVSPPGEGATFRIFLPPYAPGLTVEPPPAAPVRRAPRDLSGVGRLLFVEDEDRVRDIAARLLRARGYEVIEARDGEEALALAREHTGSIDLMISDVSMPGMDGPTLLKAARPYLGAAPVMFISGYAESEFSDLLEGERGISFLAKPLHLQTLAERVKERLSGG